MTQQAELIQLDSRRIPATSEHTCLQLRVRRQPLCSHQKCCWDTATPLRATRHGQKNCTHHHPADSAPGSKAPARRRIRPQSAGSKAPLRGQRALRQRTANFHRLDNLIVAALAWLSTLVWLACHSRRFDLACRPQN